MKIRILTLLCLVAFYGTAVADDIATQLKAMEAEKDNYAKLKKSSQGFYAENCPKYLDFWQQAAEQGHAIAQSFLGVCYSHGRGITKDQSLAVAWYRKAAEQGYAPAQANLGVMYRDGKGVAKDESQAVQWLRKAAEQGYAPAQINLASIYANSKSNAKNETEAVEWFTKAAEQGYAPAQANLAIMYRDGKGIAKDETQATTWFAKANQLNQQNDLLDTFMQLCKEYDQQPSIEQKNKIYKKSLDAIEKANEQGIDNWQGTLTKSQTARDNSNISLSISIGASSIIDQNIDRENPVYDAAINMKEHEKVLFSGEDLAAYDFSERGKLCAPDFQIKLTKLSKNSPSPKPTTTLATTEQENAKREAETAIADYALSKGLSVEQLTQQLGLSHADLLARLAEKILSAPNADRSALLQSFEQPSSSQNAIAQDSGTDALAAPLPVSTEKPTQAAEATGAVDTQSCLDIARTGIIADTQEIICGLKGQFKAKLMNLYADNGCSNLVTNDQFDKLNTEVIHSIKAKYIKMGEKAYCSETKSYYNGIVKAFNLITTKAKD